MIPDDKDDDNPAHLTEDEAIMVAVIMMMMNKF